MDTIDTIDTIAAAVAAAAAPHAGRHDVEGSFVEEGVAAARDRCYLAAPVPVELGGAGATVRDIAQAQRILAAACGSTALACAMHLHVTLAAAWRWRRGDALMEPILRRVARDRLVITSTGGNDWATPSTVATPVDGGWRVSGRKTFCSISPAADVAATFAVVGRPEPGADVIAFGLPLTTDGVTLAETWDAAGMRGTGSHDLVLEDVFVEEAQLTGRRTWGELDHLILVTGVHAFPVIYATYLGIAEALVAEVLGSGRVTEASARSVGLLDFHLRAAGWALDSVLNEIGDDPDATVEGYLTLQQMKRAVTVAVLEIAGLAAEVAGGGCYARRGAIDRMIRDLRAAIYHPHPPEATLVTAGRARLGLPFAA